MYPLSNIYHRTWLMTNGTRDLNYVTTIAKLLTGKTRRRGLRLVERMSQQEPGECDIFCMFSAC